METVGSFGNPKALSRKLLLELSAELKAGRSASIAQVADWLANPGRAGIRLSNPTVRKYCRELGFELPANASIKSKATKPAPKYSWTALQLRELKRYGRKLGSRAKAILIVGTSDRTITRVAIECGVDYRRLCLDLKYFVSGRLQQALNHTSHGKILVVRGVKEDFFKWCAGQHDLNGRVPSAAEAQSYLKSNYKISMARSTAYSHLNVWQKHAGIPRRPYIRGKKWIVQLLAKVE